jgi:hypothetical protein
MTAINNDPIFSAMGFQPPVISAELSSMQGPIPNVISLPYGRYPPLHLQTPSWRQLLRLMAKLSSTRIEATVEAVATTTTAFKLRTVLQFVKVGIFL